MGSQTESADYSRPVIVRYSVGLVRHVLHFYIRILTENKVGVDFNSVFG